ncbi:hypothetical protein D3C81_1863810 [compost metagenome]
MHNLPINKARIDLPLGADKVGNFISFIVQQPERARAQAHGSIDHLFTWPRHQIKQHQFVFIRLRHVVDDLTQSETNQIVGHILRQLETGSDLTVHFIATAAADAVVGVIL